MKDIGRRQIQKMAQALIILPLLMGCNASSDQQQQEAVKDTAHNCMQTPTRFAGNEGTDAITFNGDTTTTGMILIPGGQFQMGGDNDQADKDEYPKHTVELSSFYMDITEVTNAQFKAFADATGYVTTAEKKPDWEELKKSLPPGTPKPPDSVLVAASLVFKATGGPVNLQDYAQWWEWVPGANWKEPQGPGSTITGKDNYPVIHISWDDAMAYCKWSGKRLPTEAEWEYAARGGQQNNIYPWGNEHINTGQTKANSWEGNFPYLNKKTDGYVTSAPVKQYAPNKYGLYDMAGNVWEWCSDWYNFNYYQTAKEKISINPKGPAQSYDPQDPYTPKRSLRGGSFLCNDTYCSGYRVARRMKTSPDTGMEHTGFRCVRDKTN
jgi:sulfatase modifying factor 1